jgi:hypothetical protein
MEAGSFENRLNGAATRIPIGAAPPGVYHIPSPNPANRFAPSPQFSLLNQFMATMFMTPYGSNDTGGGLLGAASDPPSEQPLLADLYSG